MKIVRKGGLVDHSFRQYSPNGAETDLVASLVRASIDAGVRVSPSAIVNLYVALKSKPLAIITGPANSGKVTAVQTFAHVLTGGDITRFHQLMGHAWWAGQSGNVGLFTEAQARLNAGEIIDLMREAWRSGNAERMLVACLERISPAEVDGLFSEVALQLRHGHIMQLPGLHLTRPVPYPPNLLIIGTLDVDRFEVPNPDLLEMVTVIHWPGASKTVSRSKRPICAAGERTYLHARIRTEREACLRLGHTLELEPSGLQPLFQVENVLRQHHAMLPSWVRGAVLIYLANAWDEGGHGLFDCHAARQRAIACDLALAQIVLPHVMSPVVNLGLAGQLKSALAKDFPYAASVLDSMSHC